MLRIYNNKRTFLLTATDGTTHVVPPLAFDEIEDKFAADITFRTAVRAGEIQVFETAKQGDAIERNARGGAKKPGKKTGSKQPTEPSDKQPADDTNGEGEEKAADAE